MIRIGSLVERSWRLHVVNLRSAGNPHLRNWLNKLVHAFETANQMKLPYVIGPRRDGDLAVFWADAQKAETILGWTATHSVEDMCRSAWLFAKNSAM